MDMIDADEGLVEREGERFGGGDADDKGADQPRPMRNCNSINGLQ